MPSSKDIFSELRDEKIIYEKLKANVIELPTWEENIDMKLT